MKDQSKSAFRTPVHLSRWLFGMMIVVILVLAGLFAYRLINQPFDAPTTIQQPLEETQEPGDKQNPLKDGGIVLEGVPHYRIQLDIDLDALKYQGEMYLDYVNNEEITQDHLFFRLLPNGKGSFGDGSLSVSFVEVNGNPVSTSLSIRDTVLKVELPDPLESGHGVQLKFVFEGLIPENFGNSEGSSGYGIFNYSDKVLALSAWYPMLSVYDQGSWSLHPTSYIGDSIFSDCAYYSVTIRLPADMQLIATGIEQEQDIAGSEQILTYESGPVRDFFIVASPNFEKSSQFVDGTDVNVFYLPGQKTAAQQALSVAVESLKVFNQQFGPYPYTELDVVEAPMRYALGVEFPGIVLISSDLFVTPEKPEFAVTVAHEVAHQWWYNVVGNHVFEEPWLDEGLVTYSSSLYYEFGPMQSVPLQLISFWQGRVAQIVQAGQDEMIVQPLEYFENLEDTSVYSRVVYMKAALFFYELRREIGDEAFFSALRNYYQEQQFKIAHAQDLFEAFETASGRSLETFYSQKLYSAQP
ncbi:MAG TPA: M1 family metallopeptidase [Anaerolineales bacterium]|nr:M1 family metallopeptidase [Anaerolineales bacterium]